MLGDPLVLLWEQEATGSNPGIPTTAIPSQAFQVGRHSWLAAPRLRVGAANWATREARDFAGRQGVLGPVTPPGVSDRESAANVTPSDGEGQGERAPDPPLRAQAEGRANRGE